MVRPYDLIAKIYTFYILIHLCLKIEKETLHTFLFKNLFSFKYYGKPGIHSAIRELKQLKILPQKVNHQDRMSQCAFPGKMFVHIIFPSAGRVSPYIHKGIEGAY